MIVSIEDISPLEQLCLTDISYSRLDTYLTCPAKYFYSYIEQQERMFGAAASLGSMVHGVLETVVGDEPLDLGEMYRYLEQQRLVHDPDRLVTDELMDAGTNILAEFVDRHEGEEFHVYAKEMPFAIVVGSSLICGYIDRVDRRPSGGIHIIDYKTGKWEVAAKNIAENLQLGIYALAASYYFPGESIQAELYYLRSGRRKSHTFTPADLEIVERRVIDLVDEMIHTNMYHPTDNARVCSFCDYRKNGSCKVGIGRYGGTD